MVRDLWGDIKNEPDTIGRRPLNTALCIMGDHRDFDSLIAFLTEVPGIAGTIGKGRDDSGCWWVKFSIDIGHPLAWQVVQELGCALNYLSLNERLPTTFKPVSPAPYLNGGPREYLSWVIESHDPQFKPETAAQWLHERLPQPVGDTASWLAEDDV